LKATVDDDDFASYCMLDDKCMANCCCSMPPAVTVEIGIDSVDMCISQFKNDMTGLLDTS